MTTRTATRGLERMLKGLRERNITDERVLSAFENVPRGKFVSSPVARIGVSLPIPIPIGHGQTLSQAYIVARMLELAEIPQDGTVLDVGSGSGYQTAVIAKLCAHVHAIERISELSQRAQRTVHGLGIHNTSFHVGDGRLGVPAHAPYDAILVAATATTVPQELVRQLKEGGRLIIPLGHQMSKREMLLSMLQKKASPQQLYRFTKLDGHAIKERFEDVYFVPFVGA